MNRKCVHGKRYDQPCIKCKRHRAKSVLPLERDELPDGVIPPLEWFANGPNGKRLGENDG